MINDEFVNDLTRLLYEVTTSGKTQTLYVDVKIATMILRHDHQSPSRR